MTVISDCAECCGRAANVWFITQSELFFFAQRDGRASRIFVAPPTRLMPNSRYLAWPAYLVAIAMLLIPMADSWTTLFPWNLGDARWRFGAVGLISNALMIPLAGLLIAFTVAWAREQRRVMRIIGVVGFVGALLCILALGSFALDSLQTRSQVRDEMRLSFTVASITAALKTLLGGATFLAFGLSGWRAARHSGTRTSNSAAGGLFTLPTAPSTMKSGELV